ncbi:MAG: hypothetical protein HZC37_18530 [Burkholderiales bacterium]|nr:hypothetical protein [Burkholderiales bacterium]
MNNPQSSKRKSPVAHGELVRTVTRLEARLASIEHEAVREAFALYRSLVARFEDDLGPSARDVALAKASALMLVQSIAQAKAAA